MPLPKPRPTAKRPAKAAAAKAKRKPRLGVHDGAPPKAQVAQVTELRCELEALGRDRAELCSALHRAGARILLDATGEQLALALAEAPELVKVNREEALSALGFVAAGAGDSRPVAASAGLAAEALGLCRRIADAGAGDVVVTLGGAGSVALIGGGAWRADAPAVRVVNTTGSGDCFAAALMLALERGEGAAAALAAAAGAAAANAADPVTGRFDPALARDLASRATVEPLPLSTGPVHS